MIYIDKMSDFYLIYIDNMSGFYHPNVLVTSFITGKDQGMFVANLTTYTQWFSVSQPVKLTIRYSARIVRCMHLSLHSFLGTFMQMEWLCGLGIVVTET